MAHTHTTRLAALALFLAPACIHVDDDDYHDPYIEELEPNDSHWTAQHLGTLGVGERLLVRGSVTDTGYDRFDGFALRSEQPMDVEFLLYAENPHDDFDVELFDPYTHTTVAVWQSAVNPESGWFSVLSTGFEFHLVVSSFHGSGAYTLEVRGTGLGWAGDGPAGAVAGTGVAGTLQASGTPPRAGRAVDWTPYAATRAAAPAAEAGPVLGVTTILIDPATGRVLSVHARRLHLGALDAAQD